MGFSGFMWVSLFLFCFPFGLLQVLENFSCWVVGVSRRLLLSHFRELLLFFRKQAHRVFGTQSRSYQESVAKPGLKPDPSEPGLLWLTSIIFKLAFHTYH